MTSLVGIKWLSNIGIPSLATHSVYNINKKNCSVSSAFPCNEQQMYTISSFVNYFLVVDVMRSKLKANKPKWKCTYAKSTNGMDMGP